MPSRISGRGLLSVSPASRSVHHDLTGPGDSFLQTQDALSPAHGRPFTNAGSIDDRELLTETGPALCFSQELLPQVGLRSLPSPELGSADPLPRHGARTVGDCGSLSLTLGNTSFQMSQPQLPGSGSAVQVPSAHGRPAPEAEPHMQPFPSPSIQLTRPLIFLLPSS